MLVDATALQRSRICPTCPPARPAALPPIAANAVQALASAAVIMVPQRSIAVVSSCVLRCSRSVSKRKELASCCWFLPVPSSTLLLSPVILRNTYISLFPLLFFSSCISPRASLESFFSTKTRATHSHGSLHVLSSLAGIVHDGFTCRLWILLHLGDVTTQAGTVRTLFASKPSL